MAPINTDSDDISEAPPSYEMEIAPRSILKSFTNTAERKIKTPLFNLQKKLSINVDSTHRHSSSKVTPVQSSESNALMEIVDLPRN